MKKIIAICSLFGAIALMSVKAQTIGTSTVTFTAPTLNTYSVVNTAAVNLQAKVPGSYKTVSVQYVCTKSSGTVAGTAVLYGSIDGANYHLIANRMFRDSANSFTNTNVTSQTKIWTISDSPYLYYRVLVTGSGTMCGVVSAVILPKKEN